MPLWRVRFGDLKETERAPRAALFSSAKLYRFANRLDFFFGRLDFFFGVKGLIDIRMLIQLVANIWQAVAIDMT